MPTGTPNRSAMRPRKSIESSSGMLTACCARPPADAARAERPEAAGAARTQAPPSVELETAHRADAARTARPDRGLVDRGLSVIPRRRREGERPHEQDVTGNPSRPRQAERS